MIKTTVRIKDEEKEIRNLPNKLKKKFLPPVAMKINIQGAVFEIMAQNIGQMRFSAQFIGVEEKEEEKENV